jgi:hypothetical protein
VETEEQIINRLPEEEVRRMEACRELNRLLDTQKSVPVGKSQYFARNEQYRRKNYGVPSEDTLRGFEIVNGRVYPAVARAVRRLNLEGIITRQQLAGTDLEQLKLKEGIGPKTYAIAVLLQILCRDNRTGG